MTFLGLKLTRIRGFCGSAGDRLSASWRRLIDDRRGGVAVFLAFAVIPMMGFIGIGFDTARAYMVKSRLSSALDSAGLAGGWSFFLTTRNDDILMFFEANFPTGFLGSVLTGPNIIVDEANEKILLNASARVPTTFMRLFGSDDITVYAEAEVTRQMKALDVVLSIDISGSMGYAAAGGGTRIQAAKEAATELVDILFGQDSTEEFLSIGLVPWSSKVKVMTQGQAFNPALTTTLAVPAFIHPETGVAQSLVYFANNSEVPLLTAPPNDWRGCVFNRYVDDGTDATDGDIRYGAYSGGGKDWPAWQPVFNGTHPMWGGEPIAGWQKCQLSRDDEECTSCPSPGITPLQHAKATVLNAINALSPGGNTNLPAGLGWAWRVLMPTPPFTEAVLDPDYDRDQAIVLLTDGENCPYSGDGYKRVFGGCDSTGQAGMDDRLRKLAANVKADGVVVYVIQFANAGTELQDLLKEVASGPNAPYYHYAPDSASLRQVFREVANHLAMLRLSK